MQGGMGSGFAELCRLFWRAVPGSPSSNSAPHKCSHGWQHSAGASRWRWPSMERAKGGSCLSVGICVFLWFECLASKICVSIQRPVPSNKGVKALLAIALAVVGTLIFCTLGSDERLLAASSWPPSETAWLGETSGNPTHNPLMVSHSEAVFPRPNTQPEHNVPMIMETPHGQTPAHRGQLSAGVYKSWPYTCIVVVPGPCPDDKAILKPEDRNYQMPVVRPDLQFIPLFPTNR
jgi:hypothetical protein